MIVSVLYVLICLGNQSGLCVLKNEFLKINNTFKMKFISIIYIQIY